MGYVQEYRRPLLSGAVTGPRGLGGEGDGVGKTDGADPGDDLAAGSAASLPMADLMAGMPGVWRRLLAAHVADRLGRCRGCRSDTGAGTRWPCSLNRIATEAQRLHDQRLARAVETD